MMNDDRTSTASSVSGMYQNILQAPAPICMFYFSHPFGISTPLAPVSMSGNESSSSSTPPSTMQQNAMRQMFEGSCRRNETATTTSTDDPRIASYVPWPEATWRRDAVFPTIVEMLAKRKGQNLPDLETILTSIQQAWNTPNNRSSINSAINRDDNCSITSSTWDLASHTLTTEMGSGTYAPGVGPGLLRRRYSVPEIIMRRHNLSQQKSNDESSRGTTTTTSTTTTTNTTIATKNLSGKRESPPQTPEISLSSGSDSNLSRGGGEVGGGREISMRKSTLLRRIWSKELKRHDARSGSWSPPLRRTHRKLHISGASVDSSTPVSNDRECLECKKLNEEYDSEASPKRLRLTKQIHVIDDNNYSESEFAVNTTTPQTIHCDDSDCNFPFPTPTDTATLTPGPQESGLRVDIESQQDNSDVTSDSGNHEGLSRSETDDNLSVSTTICQEITRPEPNDDKFISNLLIDSLNNIVNTPQVYQEPSAINNNRNSGLTTNITASSVRNSEQFSADLNDNQYFSETVNNNIKTNNNNNNSKNNSKVTFDECEIPSAYLSTELIQKILNERTNKANGNFIYGGLTQQQINYTATGQRIFFPRYSAESRSDLSSHTSLASEPEPIEITQVGSGSVYPINGLNFVVIPRLSAIPRTESMEVQGSGAEDDDRSEGSVSLVDSLDDPASPKQSRPATPVEPPIEPPITDPEVVDVVEPEIEPTQSATTTSREKGESFFVSITDEHDIMDEQLGVSESMPEKLREKLQRRQMELDARKELDYHHKHIPSGKENFNGRSKKNAIVVLSDPVAKTEASPVVVRKNGTKGKNGSRTELGMLESYTIDARGNMQFNGGEVERGTAVIKIIPKTKNPVNNSTVATKKIVKNSKNEVIKVKRSEKVADKFSKDSQSLILYPNQSDLTPDVEGGPRRVYQKTEIHDNGKQIEILEIVEMDSGSPDYQRSSRSKNSQSGSSTPNQKKSMIPIPVTVPVNPKSAVRVLPNSHIGKRDKIDRVIADLLMGAITDPDQSVVELIHSPKDIMRAKNSGKSNNPKHKQITKRGSATNVRYSQKFDVIPEERSSMSSNDESKSQKSKKLQIIRAKNNERFIAMTSSSSDAPGSKQSSRRFGGGSRNKMSTSSSSNTNVPRALDVVNNNTMKSPTFIKASSNDSKLRNYEGNTQKTKISPWASSSSSSPPKFWGRGRDAIEPDVIEPRAWIGFFRQHDGSANDSPTEDSITPKRSGNETKFKSKKPSTNAGKKSEEQNSPPITTLVPSLTPATTTSIDNNYAITSETENTQSNIETTTTAGTHKNDDEKSISSSYLKECLNKENCTQCKTKKNGNHDNHFNSPEKSDPKASPTKRTKKLSPKGGAGKKPEEIIKGCDCIEKGLPLKVNELNVWQVCGANDCKLIQSKIDAFEAQPAPPKSGEKGNRREGKNSFSVFLLDDDQGKFQKNGKSPKKTQKSKSTFDGSSVIYHDPVLEQNHINGDDSQRSGATLGTTKDETKPESARENCDDCCFCNPKLHRKGVKSSSACQFCKKKQNETPHTADTSRTKTDDEYRSNMTYELLTKTDHTHTKTKIHDSDVVSTKCKKTNEKIKRKFLPDPHRLHPHSPYSPKSNHSSSSQDTSIKKSASTSGPAPAQPSPKTPTLARPKNTNNIPRTKSLQSIQKMVKDEVPVPNAFRNHKNSKKSKSQTFRLPSPYGTTATDVSSHKDYDTSSSHSDGSVDRHLSPSNGVAQMAANRWKSSMYQKQIAAKKWASRQYQEINSSRPRGKWGAQTAVVDAPGNHQGWSVTVAGNCCHSEMAPDVEMRLCFPNQTKFESYKSIKSTTNGSYRSQQQTQNFDDDDDATLYENYYQQQNAPITVRNQRIAALPQPSPTLDKPKRSLMKANEKRNQSLKYNFPELNTGGRGGGGGHTQIIRETAKKAIKKVECSVAVTSATRTISHIPQKQRSMSYQCISIPETPRVSTTRKRDHSIDIGTNSSRRMSYDSQTPSGASTRLSVMGNAIAPEQKPKVPTMSERDLTRRHGSCFIRNNGFLS